MQDTTSTIADLPTREDVSTRGFDTIPDSMGKRLAASIEATSELRMTRVLDAAKPVVFEAWSKAEYVSRWFTPAPLTTPSCEVDLRNDGVFRVVMRTPDGIEYPMEARFTEVVPDERIVFEARIHGGVEVNTTVTFDEYEGKTTLRVHQVYSRETDDTRGARSGWTQTLNQLAAHLCDRAR